MRIFVSEYVCGGGWPEPVIAGSLAIEGRAMLTALLVDLATIPGVSVSSTWDARLGSPFAGSPRAIERVQFHIAHSPAEERELFDRLARAADATWVIAPEFDNILETRCRIVEALGKPLAGPGSDAVALCGDKLALARRLVERGIPTIPTRPFEWARLDPTEARFVDAGSVGISRFPIVVKPRFGAGSQSTFLITNEAQLRDLSQRWDQEPMLESAIWQPYLEGTPVSVAVVCDGARDEYEPLPVARQCLSSDGRFQYLGGSLPLTGELAASVQETAVAACRAVGGLKGYVGVDLLADAASASVAVVEINPRLTTSYLGYRRLVDAEPATIIGTPDLATSGGWRLAQRILGYEPVASPLRWQNESITFGANGEIV